LVDVIRLLRPAFLIGVGGFAETRLAAAAERCGGAAKVARILHPSPASPAANRGWAEAATRQMVACGAWTSAETPDWPPA
jgi:single-strand selective monofunctional uracil DNA glycosylase